MEEEKNTTVSIKRRQTDHRNKDKSSLKIVRDIIILRLEKGKDGRTVINLTL